MSRKIFGVGNPLLCDDGVGVWLSKGIVIPPDATVIQGEIFVADCLLHIEEGDAVIILDAVQFELPAGEVVVLPFEDCKRYFPPMAFCHDASLLHSLLYGNQNTQGFLIGVQVAEIRYFEGLSPALTEMLPDIVERVNRAIAAACARFCGHKASRGM